LNEVFDRFYNCSSVSREYCFVQLLQIAKGFEQARSIFFQS